MLRAEDLAPRIERLAGQHQQTKDALRDGTSLDEYGQADEGDLAHALKDLKPVTA